ncbi:MAG: sugar transferase [Gemmatimonadaceae bacterium]|nr:sugar transferase [Gemmatimonadaceae bacterium]
MEHSENEDVVSVSWTGKAEFVREDRAGAPSTRRNARVIESRIERPRSVDAHGRDDVLDVTPRDRHEGLSRAMNMAVAGFGLLVSLPVLVVAAVLIKLSSRGPILYTQTRVGLDRRWKRTLAMREARVEDLGGQVFTIYKLRTMRVDAEKRSGAVWATENDPRVTRLGKFLRKYRIDELPQLWNILLGDMNLVGPRPERPSIVARLREDIPEYRFRHRVKPGLTGLAQINQKYDACLEDVRAKVNWDLRYINTQGFWVDLGIMLKTVPSVLLKFQGW